MTRAAELNSKFEEIANLRAQRLSKPGLRKPVLPRTSSSSSSASQKNSVIPRRSPKPGKHFVLNKSGSMSLNGEEHSDDNATDVMLEAAAARKQRNRWDEEQEQEEDVDEVSFGDDEDEHSPDEGDDDETDGQIRIGKWSEEREMDTDNFFGGGSGSRSHWRQTDRSSSDTTLEEVTMGLILPKKLRTMSTDDDSKTVTHRALTSFNRLAKLNPMMQDLQKRPEVQALLERIKLQRSPNNQPNAHPLTFREIKEALSDPELANLAHLLQELYGV